MNGEFVELNLIRDPVFVDDIDGLRDVIFVKDAREIDFTDKLEISVFCAP